MVDREASLHAKRESSMKASITSREFAVNSHLRGQRIAREVAATATKASRASHEKKVELPLCNAWAPRNEVVTAAAESNSPALVRTLSIAACCSDRARTASS